MKALELADAMEIRASIRKKATNRKSVQENTNDRLADQLTQAATMLRQQQAEIEVLKNKHEFLSGHAQQSDIMINELRQELALQRLSDIGQAIEEDRESAIYATGYWNGIAKRKPCELTDEKIWKLWQTHLNDDITVFARALLKKAREK